ncbi:hypothetical protein EVG20_g5818 [Dentipellis fragilis]|uniref:Geranylgeranyl pyrophosphate synthetase n=1 Tax=Dentipellis fragilis TaxID=205917 RepID=A0A4Y9YSS3_9AGAM|nr:hypothetical protein EVG20_g5818 [Dentipellis fragilis]
MAYYNPLNHRLERTRAPVPSHYNVPPDRDITEDLVTSSPVEIFTSLVVDGNLETVDVQNVRYIGSYNWIDATSPTIIVPGLSPISFSETSELTRLSSGSPPVWKDPSMPIKLTPDTGLRFVDQNGFRIPSSPLLPLFASVDVIGTPVEWPSVDFILDRNALRKITRWIDCGPMTVDFRIDMELAGPGTVLMNRWEPRTKDVAGNGRSYGFAFEETNTVPVPGCERSTGHYRIVQYDFCGLDIIVRFEVDTCIATTAGAETADQCESATFPAMYKYTPASILNIIPAGHAVLQASIVELKTRSKWFADKVDWSSIYPQLYFSATSLLYLGIHDRGKFSQNHKFRTDDEGLEGLRAVAKESFRKLGEMLQTIRKMVIQHGKAKQLSLVCEGGVLTVYERCVDEKCLPDSILARFY